MGVSKLRVGKGDGLKKGRRLFRADWRTKIAEAPESRINWLAIVARKAEGGWVSWVVSFWSSWVVSF